MNCPTCGYQIPDYSPLCEFCGSPIPQTAPHPGAPEATAAPAQTVQVAVDAPVYAPAPSPETTVPGVFEQQVPSEYFMAAPATESEGTSFTPMEGATSGVPSSQSVEVPPAPMASVTPLAPTAPSIAPSQPGSGFAVVGIIAGILCIVSALAGLAMTPEALQSTSFGADFYTYTYKGLVALSGQILTLVRMTCVGLIAFGIFLICYFGWQLAQSKEG